SGTFTPPRCVQPEEDARAGTMQRSFRSFRGPTLRGVMLLPVLAALLLLAPTASADTPPPPDEPKSSPCALFDDDVRFSLGFPTVVGCRQAGPFTQAAFPPGGLQSEKLWYLLRPPPLSRRRTEALLLGTATAVGCSGDNPLTAWGTMLAGSQWGLWKLDP